MAKLLLIQGPNLNMLGIRESQLYGTSTLADICNRSETLAQALGHEIHCFQSNAEHELINSIHEAYQQPVDFIIINPGAFTHTSIALRDALLAVKIPFIELHLSNIHARETFRHHSYLSDIALGVIFGFGAFGYELAIQAAHHHLQN